MQPEIKWGACRHTYTYHQGSPRQTTTTTRELRDTCLSAEEKEDERKGRQGKEYRGPGERNKAERKRAGKKQTEGRKKGRTKEER